MNAPTRRPGPPTDPPAAKRQRKAINCEPCRASKLKCDRNRPCSSCVLRGTTSACYQGADAALYRPPSFTQPATVSPTLSSSGNPPSSVPFDAAYHLGQIRQSLSALETQFGTDQAAPELMSVKGKGKESEGYSNLPTRPLGRTEAEGLYAGPTTLVAHLMPSGSSNSLRDGVSFNNVQQPHHTGTCAYTRDADLRKELPHISVTDGLIDYYFDYCSWIFKHIDRLAFTARWQEYKASPSSSYNRLLLAMEAIICAIAIHYVPPQHEFAKSLRLSCASGDESCQGGRRADELGVRWYNVCRAALAREQAERRTYNLDVVEILLARGHFLLLTKIDTEENWAVRGELIAIATAMGLHRDPGTKMPNFVAERKRWAWSHIIAFECWLAFMLGRPLAISPDHYDTRFPSPAPIPLLSARHPGARVSHPSPSQIDTSPPSPPRLLNTPESIASSSSTERTHGDVPTGDETRADADEREEGGTRTYEAHIALFRLATVLGRIMDDAVKLVPVDYSRVMTHDGELESWLKALPETLKLSPAQIAQNLASFATGSRRLGVQALNLRMTMLHIRFTLHRPYATQVAGTASSLPKDTRAFSLMIALESAKELIELVTIAAPQMTQQDVPSALGDLNWASLHVFSAAMFLVFTIVNSPPKYNAISDQSMDTDRNAGQSLFDVNTRIPHINRAIDTLRRLTSLPSTDKALEVLRALAPLYHTDYINATAENRERMKRAVLPRVQAMGMPLHEGGTLSVVGGGSDGGREDGSAEGPLAPAGSSAASRILPSFNSLDLHSDHRHHAGESHSGGVRRIPTPGATPPPSHAPSWAGAHARDHTARTDETSIWRTVPSGSTSNERGRQEETWVEGEARQGLYRPERRMSSGVVMPELSGSSEVQLPKTNGSYAVYSASHSQGRTAQTGYDWDRARTAQETASAFPYEVGGPPVAVRGLPALNWGQTRRDSGYGTIQEQIAAGGQTAAHEPGNWGSSPSQAAPYNRSGAGPAHASSNDLGGVDATYSAGPQPDWLSDLPQISGYGSNAWPSQQTQATDWIPPSTDDYTQPVQHGGFGHGMPGLSGMQSFTGFGFSDVEMQLMLGDQNVTPSASTLGGGSFGYGI
ncbi:hypothetical protein PENSPDRAFT_618134 [Peniophora sp. CONT]|nr:hypothetical protein PENSPDRAFT_618134 [Peniophora sp. CONT]